MSKRQPAYAYLMVYLRAHGKAEDIIAYSAHFPSTIGMVNAVATRVDDDLSRCLDKIPKEIDRFRWCFIQHFTQPAWQEFVAWGKIFTPDRIGSAEKLCYHIDVPGRPEKTAAIHKHYSPEKAVLADLSLPELTY